MGYSLLLRQLIIQLRQKCHINLIKKITLELLCTLSIKFKTSFIILIGGDYQYYGDRVGSHCQIQNNENYEFWMH